MTPTIPLAMKQVLERYNLDLTRDQHGNYRVEDRVIKSFYTGSNDPSKSGVYTNRKLDTAVAAAVTARKEHDAEMTRRSGFSTKVEAAPAQPVAKAPRKRAAAATPAPVVTAPAPPKRARVMIDLDDEPDDDAPSLTLELDDVELDDTGKRERSRKEPPRRSQKENMYQSAAKVLMKSPFIKVEALAVQGVLALSTAERCLLAWNEYLSALDTAGCLTAAGKRLLPVAKRGAAK
jgi:hypothetical protein